MNLLNNVTPYVLTLAVAAVIPGPGMLGLLFRTINNHYRNGFFMLFGLITGDLIYLTIALSGLSFLGKLINHQFNLILISLACGYLLFITWKLWTLQKIHIQSLYDLNNTLSNSNLTQSNLGARHTFYADYLTGLLLTLSNPKTISFYLALVPAIFGTQLVLSFNFLTIIILSTILTLTMVGSFYIFSALKIKKMLENSTNQNYLMKTISVIILLIALSTLWTQVISQTIN